MVVTAREEGGGGDLEGVLRRPLELLASFYFLICVVMTEVLLCDNSYELYFFVLSAFLMCYTL